MIIDLPDNFEEKLIRTEVQNQEILMRKKEPRRRGRPPFSPPSKLPKLRYHAVEARFILGRHSFIHGCVRHASVFLLSSPRVWSSYSDPARPPEEGGGRLQDLKPSQ